jgi:hypothetical protein
MTLNVNFAIPQNLIDSVYFQYRNLYSFDEDKKKNLTPL